MNIKFGIKFDLKNHLAKMILAKYFYISNLAEKELNGIALSTNSNKVWTMWLQEEVPELCQLCIQSIKKYYPDVIVITNKNFNEYVDIPKEILEKYESGKMLPAHFSDIVRMCLLDKYGGTWIDATCFLTQPIPEYIIKSPFFVLKNFKKNAISNYFLHSEANNYLTKCIKLFLLEYWKKENCACDYFMFHMFLIHILLKKDLKAKELFNKIPVGLNINTKLFYEILFDDFNYDTYEWIKSTSYMHKLTYKNFDTKNTNPKSYYRYLLKESEMLSS